MTLGQNAAGFCILLCDKGRAKSHRLAVIGSKSLPTVDLEISEVSLKQPGAPVGGARRVTQRCCGLQ